MDEENEPLDANEVGVQYEEVDLPDDKNGMGIKLDGVIVKVHNVSLTEEYDDVGEPYGKMTYNYDIIEGTMEEDAQTFENRLGQVIESLLIDYIAYQEYKKEQEQSNNEQG